MVSLNQMQSFAERLRAACLTVGPIAEICRRSGINRQQFNKYLAGKVMPSAATLRRICSVIGVLEHTLFEGPAFSAGSDNIGILRPLATLYGGAVRQRLDFHVPEVESGAYMLYFHLPATPDMLLRSALFIRDIGAAKSFVRVTKFQNPGSEKAVVQGLHKGLVMASKSEIYLLGLNRLTPHQLSCTVIDRRTSPSSTNGSVCQTVTRNANDLVLAPSYIAPVSERASDIQIARQSGLVPAADVPDVALALRNLA